MRIGGRNILELPVRPAGSLQQAAPVRVCLRLVAQFHHERLHGLRPMVSRAIVIPSTTVRRQTVTPKF